MKSFFKRALRSIFILSAAVFAFCTVISCEQPKGSSTTLYQNTSTNWKSVIKANFSSLDGNVYKASWGDWVKFFIDDGELKMFKGSYTYDFSWNAPYKISAENAKSKTFAELCTEDTDGHFGTYVALEISDATPNNGKMLLLKSGQHLNYDAGNCYENPSVQGNVQHEGCFIPTYITISGNTIIWLEYYSTAVCNEGATGTACFAKYSTALNYLPYSKGSWTDTEYSKSASSNLKCWTLVE
ncbi:MAG: hypothetical protein ACI4LX_10355 [Treponema sp.]